MKWLKENSGTENREGQILSRNFEKLPVFSLKLRDTELISRFLPRRITIHENGLKSFVWQMNCNGKRKLNLTRTFIALYNPWVHAYSPTLLWIYLLVPIILEVRVYCWLQYFCGFVEVKNEIKKKKNISMVLWHVRSK